MVITEMNRGIFLPAILGSKAYRFFSYERASAIRAGSASQQRELLGPLHRPPPWGRLRLHRGFNGREQATLRPGLSAIAAFRHFDPPRPGLFSSGFPPSPRLPPSPRGFGGTGRRDRSVDRSTAANRRASAHAAVISPGIASPAAEGAAAAPDSTAIGAISASGSSGSVRAPGAVAGPCLFSA
jgi:hypothetical protein